VGLAGTVFIFLLAIKLYSTGLGVLFGLLTFIPCIGLIVLLVVELAFLRIALLHVFLAERCHLLHSVNDFAAEILMRIFVAEQMEGNGAPKTIAVAAHRAMRKSV